MQLFNKRITTVREWLTKLYVLEHTVRYSMKPKVKEESVATHSYFVAMIVILLVETYKFDVNVAIRIALCHDITEMEISDVNHWVKKNYPQVASALKSAEREIVNKMPTILAKPCIEYDAGTNEALVVHYADAMQCLQYAESELALGNVAMKEVLMNSMARMKKLEVEMEERGMLKDV